MSTALRLRRSAAVLASLALVAAMLVMAPAAAAVTQVTATAAVNIRSSPSTSSKIVGGLYRGQTVTAHSSSNGWTKIEFAGDTAYIASRYLSTERIDAPATVTGNRVTITAVNLRKGPGLSYDILRVVGEDTSVQLTGRSARGFVEVMINGDPGWISTQYLATSTSGLPAAIGTRVARADLAIRTSSSDNARVVGEIKKGKMVSVTGTAQNGRAQIVYGQTVRWVTAKYLSNIEVALPPGSEAGLPATTGTRYATADLNLWNASTGAGDPYEIPRGTAVKVTGTEKNGRAQIVYSNTVRWVTAKHLSPVEAEPDKPLSRDVGDAIPASWEVTERQLTAKTIKLHRAVREAFPQIQTVGGWYRSNAGEHPTGRAVDIMIPNYKSASGRELGYEIAAWAKQNARPLNVMYVVWRQQIWNVQRDREGWRYMADRGDDSSNHINHVHISVLA